MGDTIYYSKDGVPVPYDSLPDSTKKMVDDVLHYYQQQHPEHSFRPADSYLPAILTLLSFAAVTFVLVRKAWKTKGSSIVGSWSNRYNNVEDTQLSNDRQQLLSDYFVYEGRDLVIPDEQYQKILDKYSPYYRQLFPDLKDKFLQRTKKFLASKTFLIKSNEPFVEMPVMLSATAVQLTFGLHDYLLPYFQYIRVYPEEYFASDSLRVLAGHVYGNTITLAWNQFLKGNETYNDGVNVGLHEMAHALYFQYMEADLVKSRSFVSNFKEVMEEGEELYQLKKADPAQLFSKNAYRNLQEFWAESVELFFERPSDLKNENSELYESLKDILDQDPVNALYPVIA